MNKPFINKGAIIIFLVNYCAFLFSQNLEFSRDFDAPKKNIPVEIINSNPSYFYVIRQNKFVHDITIERRAKPSAEIIAFTPLKLDSVNATWFDYENLDYMVFENNYKLYFLFEKVLNTKKTLYLKIIDTTGKSSGFIELASLEKDNATTEFSFSYKRTTNNNILIIASRTNITGIRRKVALLFSPEKRKMVWTKKLPLENSVTVYSSSFVCNDQNDLYYLEEHSAFLGYDYYQGSQGSVPQPILRLDSAVFRIWRDTSAAPEFTRLYLYNTGDLRQRFIIPQKNYVFISLQGIVADPNKEEYKEQIINIKMNPFSGQEVYNTNTFYDKDIKDKLTFYDGPLKESIHKVHDMRANIINGNYLYTFSERLAHYYFKEILFRKTDLLTGEVVMQKIIPRKTFFFKDRTRYKSMAEPMMNLKENNLNVFLMESPSNLRDRLDDFEYGDFRKTTKINNSNIVHYNLSSAHIFEKFLVFANSSWDLIPLRYSSDQQSDAVFYLNANKIEKFAILKLNP